MAFQDTIEKVPGYSWVSGSIRNKLLFLLTLVALVPMGLLGYSICLLYTSPSPRDATLSRMPSSA